MCKGVQHPTRGLFLRYYLFQKTHDKLPEANSEFEGAGGSIKDAIHFALGNFIEMNKLWVRMQTSTSIKNKKRREKERRELRTIIGTAIDRIGNIEGLQLDMFRDHVLPELLRQVSACNDRIAQQFLMDSITQVFPVSFHVQTLDMYLRGVLDILSEVDARSLIIGHVMRLSEACQKDPNRRAVGDYNSSIVESSKERTESTASEDDPSKVGIDGKGLRISRNFSSCCPELIPSQADCFNSFYLYTQRLIADRAHSEYPLDPTAIVQIFESLITLIKVAYPGNTEYTEETLTACALALAHSKKPVDDECCKAVEQLFYSLRDVAPLKKTLALVGPTQLIERVHFSSQRNIAKTILRSALGEDESEPTNSTGKLVIDSPEVAEHLFSKLHPINTEDKSLPENSTCVAAAIAGLAGDVKSVKTEASRSLETEETSMFLHEQRRMCKITHLVVDEDINAVGGPHDTDNVFQILKTLGKLFYEGGESRIPFTYPGLIFRTCKLCMCILQRENMSCGNEGEEQEADDDGITKQEDKTNTASNTDGKETGKKPKIPSKKAFKFLFKLCDSLKEYPELALRLFGESAVVAARTRFAYEFISTAFTIFEDIVESQVQKRCLQGLVGYIYSCRQHGLSDETYQQLAGAAKKHSSNLIKRQAQCQLVKTCAKLYFVLPTAEEHRTDIFGYNSPNVGLSVEGGEDPVFRDDDQVLKCLQLALRIANKCIPVDNSLFVEIFDSFVYFFERQVQSITQNHLENFVTLIQDNLSKMEDEKERSNVEQHFERVMNHLRRKKKADDPKYASLNLE